MTTLTISIPGHPLLPLPPRRYLRDRSQRKLPSYHCSHATTDESTSHLLAHLITRNDEVREINALLVVTCEPPPLDTQILSTATSKYHLACAPASSPICLLALSTLLHCLLPPSHEAAFLRHLRCPRPPSTSKGSGLYPTYILPPTSKAGLRIPHPQILTGPTKSHCFIHSTVLHRQTVIPFHPPSHKSLDVEVLCRAQFSCHLTNLHRPNPHTPRTTSGASLRRTRTSLTLHL
jgi:hypothetical protein